MRTAPEDARTELVRMVANLREGRSGEVALVTPKRADVMIRAGWAVPLMPADGITRG